MLDSYSNFVKSLENDRPEEHWSEPLKAMWHAEKGNWERSHDIAQDLHTTIGSWIHAHLHRQEGDKFNAGYWYRQANRKYPTNTLAEERREITEYLLA
ncbi:hypothetical protein [Pareuzebyella sediminis]|uniref:hypothetical protein n=1 Tax=Pareuzebyella sediminis TaxID=2607998 RepID=UPI0011EFEA9F|nr:hypothetical protein [Pareuzebyella sediminis]